jgi:hypothetical protein
MKRQAAQMGKVKSVFLLFSYVFRSFFSAKEKVSAPQIESADFVKVFVNLARRPVSSFQPGADETLDRQTGTSTLIKNLRDPVAIQKLLRFVNDHLDGWYKPMHMPIESVDAIFFLENRPVAMFGSGLNFFVRGQFPGSKIILAEKHELRNFDQLLDIG